MQVLSRFLQQIPFGMMRGSKFTGLGQMCAFQNMGFCRGELLIRLCFMRRSEEHTSELQSLMRISYAVFCLKKKNKTADISTVRTWSQEYQNNHYATHFIQA